MPRRTRPDRSQQRKRPIPKLVHRTRRVVLTFKEGDKVRDLANLGGQVLETWGNGVKVSWRDGHTGWIDARFLSLDAAQAN
jgi:hypothetical protein